MSNFYLCDACGNRNHHIHDSMDGHINCKVFPELVDPIVAVDCGSHYEYFRDVSVYATPTDACKYYKPKEDR